MASETEFLNGALGKGGLGRITGIDDGSVNAEWCKTHYPQLRRALLQLTDWSFAGASVQLTLDATAPPFAYAYAYGLPPSMVKLRTYNGIQVGLNLTSAMLEWRYYGLSWKIEGNKLYSNESAAFIEYTDDITDPNRWSGLFYQMLQAWLSSALVMSIKKDGEAAQTLLGEANGLWMPEALAVDGQQHSVRAYVADDLIWGRQA